MGKIKIAQSKITQLTNRPIEMENSAWWAKLTNIQTQEEAISFWKAQKKLRNNTQTQFPTIIKHEGKNIEGCFDIFLHIQHFYNEIAENRDTVAKNFAKDNGITEEEEITITKDIETKFRGDIQHDDKAPRSALTHSKITLKELDNAIKLAKNNKRPGYDIIPSECLKLLDKATKSALLFLLNSMWELDYTPPEWQLALTKLLHKKGPESDIANYRPITLLSTLLKTWERILKTRLASMVNKTKSIPDSQLGSQKISSASLAILIKRAIFAETDTNETNIYSAQVDMNKAYNRVNRKKLWSLLKSMGIHGHLWKNIINTYSHAKEMITIGAQNSEKASLSRGLRQGSVLSPILYILYTSPLILSLLSTNTGSPWYINADELLPCIMYVDDLETFAMTFMELMDQWHAIRAYATAHQSVINYKKSSITSSVSQQDLELILDTHDLKLQPVAQCVVLGAKINTGEATNKNPSQTHLNTDVKHRISICAIAHKQMREKGLREGAINAPAAIFITKISFPPKLTFGLSSLGLTDYAKLRLRQTLANILYDIIGLDKPNTDPLWVIYDTGLPDPVNTILVSEASAYAKAKKGFLNKTCNKIISNCEPLKASLTQAAASWGTTLNKIVAIQNTHLHQFLTDRSRTTMYNTIKENPTSCTPINALQTPKGTLAHVRMGTPTHLIPALLKTRHNLLFNYPDQNSPCNLCDSGALRTYTHLITNCTFSAIEAARTKEINSNTNPVITNWLSSPDSIPLYALVGGPPNGIPLSILREAHPSILRIIDKFPLAFMGKY